MLSKSLFTSTIGLTLLFNLVACGGGYKPDETDAENVIGSPATTLSDATKIDGQDKNLISIFDNTVRKIHLFNLSDLTYKKSYSVKNPQNTHYVATQDEGKYIIDLSEKDVTIHSADTSSENIFNFKGKPISTAYRSNLNLLVVYDDTSNVGIAQLDENGNKIKSRVFGPLIDESTTLQSGDLLENGKLILALSSNEIAIVDTALSLENKKWEYSKFNTSLTNIVWLAPVIGNTNQILVKSTDKISLIDLTTQTVVSELSTTDYKIEKYSKSYNSHILMRSTVNDELKLFYAKDNMVKSRVLIKQSNYIMTSHLNLDEDTWTIVDTTSKFAVYYYYNDADYVKESRTVKRYRLTDMAALSKISIRNNAQMQLTQQYIFNLIPSELGHAARNNIESEEIKEVKLFNMKHL